MTSFRWRCCLIALLVATAGSAWGQDGAHAAGDCDMLCRLQAYMATDHMVALVPAEAAKPAVKPKKTARRSAAKTPKTVAGKVAAGKAVAGKAAIPQLATRTVAPPAAPVAVASPAPPVVSRRAEAPRRKGPRARLVAAAQSAPSTPPKAAPDTTAWQRRTLIPGSAPMMAAQFSPVQP